MTAAAAINQLRRDAHARARLAHATFQNVADIQFTRDLGDVDMLSLVDEGVVARDDEQRRYLAEIGDDVLADAVAEILLLRIVAHVDEGQNANRELVSRPFRLWLFYCGNLGRSSREDMHRGFDIFHGVLAHVVEYARGLASDLIAHDSRQRDATGCRQRLDSRRHIDAIAVDVIAIDDHFAQIDADPV